jgi:hypothetical protein
MELGSFGRSTNGTYRSQAGNDDLAMTCVNTAAFFESPAFIEIATEVWDRQTPEYKQEIHQKILNSSQSENGSKISGDLIGYLNETPTVKKPGQRQVFDSNYIDEYKSVLSKFYGNNQ